MPKCAIAEIGDLSVAHDRSASCIVGGEDALGRDQVAQKTRMEICVGTHQKGLRNKCRRGALPWGGLSAAKDCVYRGKALYRYTKFTHGLMAVSLSELCGVSKRARCETLLNPSALFELEVRNVPMLPGVGIMDLLF